MDIPPQVIGGKLLGFNLKLEEPVQSDDVKVILGSSNPQVSQLEGSDNIVFSEGKQVYPELILQTSDVTDSTLIEITASSPIFTCRHQLTVAPSTESLKHFPPKSMFALGLGSIYPFGRSILRYTYHENLSRKIF